MNIAARTSPKDAEIVRSFEDGTLRPEQFGHRQHLLVAWTYLGTLPFGEAALRFASQLKRFAESHGAEAKYHETLTWAYAALLHERMHATPTAANFDAFLAENPDLLAHPGALAPYYDADTLSSELARTVFVLPRPRR
ncbi:MAG TPA: hypothetical protein VGI39_39575 [Polyangiaceae bacterium]|jgi:hypothetical protein